MNDEQAGEMVESVLNLAVTLRDEGPAAVDRAAYEVFIAAGGDCTAALVAAAALIRVELAVDAWWQRLDPMAVTA